MSAEKFIHGKHDKGHHEGKASEQRRLDEADFELSDNQNCFSCPIFQYNISRQMVNSITDGEVKEKHLQQLEYLTGKRLEKYPNFGKQACEIFCRET